MLRQIGTHCNTPIRPQRRWRLQLQRQHTLQHTATYCNTLQHTAICYNTPICLRHERCLQLQRQHTLQHNATHCNTMQHTATQCNTLFHTATHRFAGNTRGICSCSVSFLLVLYPLIPVSMCCGVLRCVAVCCSVLQCVAV